jgi:hypothetical protein
VFWLIFCSLYVSESIYSLVTELPPRRPEKWASFTYRGGGYFLLHSLLTLVTSDFPIFIKPGTNAHAVGYFSVCHKFTKVTDVSSIAVRGSGNYVREVLCTCHCRVVQFRREVHENWIGLVANWLITWRGAFLEKYSGLLSRLTFHCHAFYVFPCVLFNDVFIDVECSILNH